MFDPTSRYFNVETAKRTDNDRDARDRDIAYKHPRIIPSDVEQPTNA